MKRKHTEQHIMTGEPSSKSFPIHITEKYARSWKSWEGVREIVQNWHDGLYETRKQEMDRLVDEKVKTEDEARDSIVEVHKETRGDSAFYDVWSAELNFYVFEEKTFPDELPKEHKFRKKIKKQDGPNNLNLGWLIFEKDQGRLCLINKGVHLTRRVLVLGFSSKIGEPEVIGQFGEGLKVGALALVREGRLFTLETGNEHWRFEINHDDDFDMKLLTVHVSARIMQSSGDPDCGICNLPNDIKLRQKDTVTSLSLEPELWLNTKEPQQAYERRFLFLKPAKDTVATALGDLLLDESLKGQMYQRKVWVSDMSNEDLATGVNFNTLNIDRDRNAVPKPSEVDHLISSMWVKALHDRHDLSHMYYKLLKNDKFRDVRQALVYVDPSVAKLIAKEFDAEYAALRQEARHIVPVSNALSAAEVERIKNSLDAELISVNEVMLKLLHMSGQHRPVEEEIKTRKKITHTVLQFNEIFSEENLVIEHALKMLQLAHPNVKKKDIDVIEQLASGETGCTREESRIFLPRWLLTDEKVHPNNKCPTEEGYKKCMCRETRLASALLAVSLPTVNYPSNSSHHDNMLLQILRPIMARECLEAEPLCKDIHVKPKDIVNTSNTPTTTNESFEREKQVLIRDMHKMKEKHHIEMDDLQRQLERTKQKLNQAERELVQGKFAELSQNEALKNEYRKQFEKAQGSWQHKYNMLRDQANDSEDRRVEYERKLLESEKLLAQRKDDLKKEEKAMERRKKNAFEDMWHHIHKWKESTQKIEKKCKDIMLRDDIPEGPKEQIEKLKEVAHKLCEELSKEAITCQICCQKQRDTVLIPCGHFRYCHDCISRLIEEYRREPGVGEESVNLTTCPDCRSEVTATNKVFA